MIFATYMDYCDSRRTAVRQWCEDLNGTEIASGLVKIDGDTRLQISFDGKKYDFSKGLSLVKKPVYHFPYPFDPPIKKTYGTDIVAEGKIAAQVYREAGTYKKILFLKSNFVFNVYLYNGNVYHCYKIGFAEEANHYYCLKTTDGRTIAVIERHLERNDGRRATVYLKDENFLELAILVTGFETMMLQWNLENFTRIHDASAGNYVSVSDAEKSLYDKDFIPAVKAMHGIYD